MWKIKTLNHTGYPSYKLDRTGALKTGDPLWFSNIHFVAKYQKLKGDTSETLNFFAKKKRNVERFEQSYGAENVRGGIFWLFQHPLCCKLSKKLKRSFGDLEKSQCQKKIEKGTLVLSGFVCYAKKETAIIVHVPERNCTIWPNNLDCDFVLKWGLQFFHNQ